MIPYTFGEKGSGMREPGCQNCGRTADAGAYCRSCADGFVCLWGMEEDQRTLELKIQ